MAFNVHVPLPFRKKQKRGRRVHDSCEAATHRPKRGAFGAATIKYWKKSELTKGGKLGEGGFAVVYAVTALARPEPQPFKGRHHRRSLSANDSPFPSTFLEAQYALKQMRPEHLQDKKQFKQAAKSLVAEAAFLGRLEHPNILKLRGLSMECSKPLFHSKSFDKYFIVTDRLEESLADRIERWQMDSTNAGSMTLISRKLDYAVQIGKAIQYLHENKIIFRDLKPDNVGLLDTHTIQLFDFGLAKDISCLPRKAQAQTTAGSDKLFQLTMCGTWRYAAPETVTTGLYDEKIDVYSWALVTYEMLLEQKPYHYMTPSVHRILVAKNGDRPPTRGFPLGLGELLDAAWDQDISQRLTMAQSLAKLQEFQVVLEVAMASSKAREEQKHNDELVSCSSKTTTAKAIDEETKIWLDLKTMLDAAGLDNVITFPKQLSGVHREVTASAA